MLNRERQWLAATRSSAVMIVAQRQSRGTCIGSVSYPYRLCRQVFVSNLGGYPTAVSSGRPSSGIMVPDSLTLSHENWIIEIGSVLCAD